MEKLGLHQKATKDMVARITVFKRTLKQWFYYASLKYLQTHQLTENEEIFLENITDYFIKSMNNIENNKEFFEKIKLEPVNIPKKKT